MQSYNRSAVKAALRELKCPSIRRTCDPFRSSMVYESLAMEEENYSDMLKRCVQTSSLSHGKALHAKFTKESLLSSLFLRNHLLIVYMKCGELVDGIQLFDEMRDRNAVSWSASIAGLVQRGCSNEALSLFCQMHRAGVKPNEFTLVSAINACSMDEKSSQAGEIYSLIVRLGFEWDVFLINTYLAALIRHGRVRKAMELFEKCLDKDVVTWNSMLAGYLQFCYSRIRSFWWRMIHEGVKPDEFTFATILTGLAALSDLKMGPQVHAQIVKYGHGDEICVRNSLVDMYLKNQNLIDGLKVFDEMPWKDVTSWGKMAAGCLQCGEPKRALGFIQEMMKAGIKPNNFTVATALNACANLGFLEEGKKAHGLKIKLGIDDVDVCVDNALVDMYAKCGCIDSAWRVFKLMKDHSVISWTSMIMGFAQNGYAKEALEIFNRMGREHVEPDYITFVCVLYACSQGGLINEGWNFFSCMPSDHGIAPGEEHYACMVDLLGRAGYTKEAKDLIQNMPFQPGILVWKTLLGACRIHRDTETGTRAAEHVLLLDKEDSSTYVLLSNIFADSSNWDGVENLRGLMERKDVQKMTGCSWIGGIEDCLVLQSHSSAREVN